MRKIENAKWSEKDAEGKTVEVSLTKALTGIINRIPPDQAPHGFDKARTFNRIGKAFDKAEKSGVLELEEADFLVLKKYVTDHIPGTWGANSDVMNAIESFVEAKQE